MDEGSRLPWLAALVLLAFTMYFAAAETALASSSRTKIRMAAEHGEERARTALSILDRFDSAISTLLICTNIAHIAIAALVTVAVTRQWGISAVSISTVLTTLVVFFAGEMLPKSLGKKYSEPLLKLCAPLLAVLMKLCSPLAALLTAIGQAAAGHTKGDGDVSVTEDELYDIIEDMTEEGSLDEEQGELITSALQFGDVAVESVLTPRVDLAAVEISSSPRQIVEYIKEQNHSRLPVYEGSIDNIVGILQIRKFIKAYLRQGDTLDLKPLLDETFFVHHSTKIDELLPIMSRRRQNMAVVTDNFGGTLGIVTVEDILEELVGEIWDEDDVVDEPIVALPEGGCLVHADETVADVLEFLGYESNEDEDELVNKLMGEWAYEQFAVIPAVGDSFRQERVQVTVSEMEHNRILKLKVSLLPETKEGGEAE